MTDRLFMYGTLKLSARSRGGRPVRVCGRLWDNGFYPAVVRGEPGGPVVAGLVFEVIEADLSRLDAREGTAYNSNGACGWRPSTGKPCGCMRQRAA